MNTGVINFQAVRGRLAALELIAQAEVNYDFDEIMEELGISEHSVKTFEPLVITNGFFEAGRFEYDPWSQAALAFIVHDAADQTIDVVAVAMPNPCRFGTRKGQAGLLGEAFLRSNSDEPCALFRNPLEWLQNEGRGVCVLNPIIAAPVIAASRCDLVAPDLEYGRRVLESGAVSAQKLLIPDNRRAA